MAERPLYGLLLAGGKSRRMGSDKAMLDRGGITQLAFAAGVLEPCVARLFVSARSDQGEDAERARYDTIVDRYQDLGPLAGILSALEEHSDADWLVLACDLPNISVPMLKYLIEQHDSDRMFTAYSSSYDGLPEPLCAIYSAGSVGTIRQFVEEGIHCPRKILIRSDTELLEQRDPHSLDNINTPDDLANSVLKPAS